MLNVNAVKYLGRKDMYLNGPKVHIFIVEVSALCQFREVALGEAESKKEINKHTHTLVSTSFP